jgi:hypothetical protein
MIAKEIDASPTTVGKAREQLSTTGQLEDTPRIGLDGRTRKTPTAAEQTPKPADETTVITTAASGPVLELTRILKGLSMNGRLRLREIALQAWSNAALDEDVTYF